MEQEIKLENNLNYTQDYIEEEPLDIKVEREDCHDNFTEKDLFETRETSSENICWNLEYLKVNSLKVEISEDSTLFQESSEFDVINSNAIFNNSFYVDPVESDRNETISPLDSGKKRKKKCIDSEIQREKKFSCSKCVYSAKSYANLKVHEAVHSDKKPYQCLKCEYSTRFSSNLYAHERKYHRRGKEDLRKKNKHVITQKKSSPSVVPQISEVLQKSNEFEKSEPRGTLKNNLGSEALVPVNLKEILPSGAGKNSTLQKLYNSKLKDKKQNKKFFSCSTCGYTANFFAQLKIHEAVHSDKKPYHCLKCEYSSKYSSNLYAHERKYHMKGKENLRKKNKHVITQKKSSPSVVPQVSQVLKKPLKFKKSEPNVILKNNFDSEALVPDNLKETLPSGAGKNRTLKKLHNSKLNKDKKKKKKFLSCSTCGYTANSFAQLKIHEAVHSDKKPYQCLKCEYSSRFSSNLYAHERKYHRKGKRNLRKKNKHVTTQKKNSPSVAPQNSQVLKKSLEFENSEPNVTLNNSFVTETLETDNSEEILPSNAGKNNTPKKLFKVFKNYLKHDSKEIAHKCIHCGDSFSDLKLLRTHEGTSKCKDSRELEIKSLGSESLKEPDSKQQNYLSLPGSNVSQPTTKEITPPNNQSESTKRMFRCKLCKFSTNVKSNFVDHEFFHTGKRPYTCLKCNFSFKYKPNLFQHGKRCFARPTKNKTIVKLKNTNKDILTNRSSSNEEEFLGFDSKLSRSNIVRQNQNLGRKLKQQKVDIGVLNQRKKQRRGFKIRYNFNFRQNKNKDTSVSEKNSASEDLSGELEEKVEEFEKDYIEECTLDIKESTLDIEKSTLDSEEKDCFNNSSGNDVLKTSKTTLEKLSSNLDYLKSNLYKVETTKDFQVLQKPRDFDVLDSNVSLNNHFEVEISNNDRNEESFPSNSGKMREFKTFYNRRLNKTIKQHNKLFSCSICGYTSKKISVMKVHVGVHSDKRPYQCSKCDFTSNVSCQLSRHKKRHHNEGKRSDVNQRKKRKCFTGQENSSNLITLQNVEFHESEHDYEKITLKCIHCGDSFSNLKLLRTHKKTSRCKDNGELKVKYSLFEDQKGPHSKHVKEDRTEYKAKIYQHIDDYKPNVRSESSKGVFKKLYHCSKCDYSTNRKADFVDHKLFHTVKLENTNKDILINDSSDETEFLGFDSDLSQNKIAMLNKYLRKKLNQRIDNIEVLNQRRKRQDLNCIVAEEEDKKFEKGEVNDKKNLYVNLDANQSNKVDIDAELFKFFPADLENIYGDEALIQIFFQKPKVLLEELKLYFCAKCDFVSESSSKLEIHKYETHLSSKKYECSECNYSLVTWWDLKRHEETHKKNVCEENISPKTKTIINDGSSWNNNSKVTNGQREYKLQTDISIYNAQFNERENDEGEEVDSFITPSTLENVHTRRENVKNVLRQNIIDAVTNYQVFSNNNDESNKNVGNVGLNHLREVIFKFVNDKVTSILSDILGIEQNLLIKNTSFLKSYQDLEENILKEKYSQINQKVNKPVDKTYEYISKAVELYKESLSDSVEDKIDYSDANMITEENTFQDFLNSLKRSESMSQEILSECTNDLNENQNDADKYITKEVSFTEFPENTNVKNCIRLNDNSSKHGEKKGHVDLHSNFKSEITPNISEVETHFFQTNVKFIDTSQDCNSLNAENNFMKTFSRKSFFCHDSSPRKGKISMT